MRPRGAGLKEEAADRAADNASRDVSQKGAEKAVARVFDSCGGKVYGHCVKCCFCAAHYDGRTAAEIAVGAVGAEDILKYGCSSASRNASHERKRENFSGNADEFADGSYEGAECAESA